MYLCICVCVATKTIITKSLCTKQIYQLLFVTYVGRSADVLKRVKSSTGPYTDVIQSWAVDCDGRPDSFPTMHVLCRLCSLSLNDLTTTCHDFLTLYPRLFFIPDHSRLFWTVQNSRKQSGTPQPSSPTFQGLRRPIPARSWLSYGPTRPFSTIKVGKSRLLGRLSMTGALLALCEGNPLVWPVDVPLMQASDAGLWCFFDLRLNKRLSKRSRRQWFETPSRSLWHGNGKFLLQVLVVFGCKIVKRNPCGCQTLGWSRRDAVETIGREICWIMNSFI